jgi:putative tryptophan/tyrosine transport system substrate-binding protein
MARAQQGERMRRIGVLITSRVNEQLRTKTIQEGLRRLGWTDGGNVRIVYRWAVGDATKLQAFAKELVDEQPDVLMIHSSIAVQAVLRETRTIPIVFMHVADPFGQGFVANAARPGGNVTGFTNFESSMGGKWLALLKEMAPDTARVAALANPGTTPYAVFLRSLEAAAAQWGIELVPALVHDTTELESAIGARSGLPGSALVVLPDVFTSTHRELIIGLAARHRVPAIYAFRFFTTNGGLMSYGVDPEEPFVQATTYVNRILKGERPGDLPIQGPTKFDLAINLKTAKALGLTVPNTLLATADEVIE